MTLKYLNLTGLNALVSAIKTWVLSRIPTKTSELTNDANFITSNDLPTNHVTTDTTQTITSQKTWTAEQTFSLPIAGSITGTASKAIADEDGTSIKSGYGKLANVNTWANVQNYKSPIKFTNDSYASGTPSENIFYASLQWGGYVNNTWSAPFTINNAIRTNGYSDTSFRTYSQTSNTLTGFVHETNADASDIAFRPMVNGTHKLGSSSYQWSSVYAQTYYYNGTAWGLDKANTWTGNNNFTSDFVLQNTSWSGVTPPSSAKPAIIEFKNSNTRQGRYINRVSSTSSETWIETIRNIDANTSYNFTLVSKIDNSGVKSLYPYTAGGTGADLGISTNQWSSVYAQTYYYNGTAWGLDKDNTWTGANSFTSVLKQRINSVYSQIPANDRFAVHEFIGTDDNRIFTVNCADRSSGQREMSLLVYDTDGTFQASGLFKESDNSFSFRPRNNNTVNLGNSTNKWKTLNGVNPGALSLPINANSASFNIDTTNWTTDGSIIIYTPLLDGWIYINARNDDTNGDSFIIFDDSVSSFGTSVFGNKGLQNSGVGLLCLMMPVNKNNSINIRIKSPGIISARLYPCLGNV